MSIAETDKQGFFPVLVETSISYKKPLTLGDQVHVELWISKLSHASAWMEFQFTNGPGEAVAQGRQRGLFVDSESGRPRRLAVEERLLFERYLVSS